MAELRPTDFVATIRWLGTVPQDRRNIRSISVQSLTATFAGIVGDYHGGLTRGACVRVKEQHPRGTEIRNTRQLSILSVEEIAEIAAEMGVDDLDPALLGVSIVVEGIPDFTHLPPASRLQTMSGTTLVVDVENGPCTRNRNRGTGAGKTLQTRRTRQAWRDGVDRARRATCRGRYFAAACAEPAGLGAPLRDNGFRKETAAPPAAASGGGYVGNAMSPMSPSPV
ncbi:hypothetical protein SAMN04488523_108153 [Sulfitobacter brevis]|uniref:MOSC domain-containing protein n=1 Tax=Sulfitobacter brevis TaxID=74348 RepID=A0A1I2BMX3_9RHOB|nr:hypothetical protein SAMN04488523_108153 [Sulfitobacter brevis]